jgi:MFS transporter, ACS family, D-galactonate transporter
LATAVVIDPATRAALLTNPTDAAAQAKAVGEVATGLGVPAPDAIASTRRS